MPRKLALLLALVLPAAAQAVTITSTNPTRNEKAAPRTTNIAATADANIDGATVTQSTFRIQGAMTGRIAGTYSTSGATFQLDPTASLKPGEWIRATATSAIQSTTAVALDKRVWQFTAAAGSATGAMMAHPTTPTFGTGFASSVALGDLDGDGDLDAVTGYYSIGSGNSVWLNDGAGNFTAHPTSPDFTSNGYDVVLGDIDGDGDLDAVVGRQGTDAETVWLNDGTGFFFAHPTTPSFGATGDTDTYGVALGDLDGDGDLDAVVANIFGEDESTWLNDGAGNFTAHPTTPVFGGQSSTDVELGDIDGDGDLDAVVANFFFEGNTVWVNDGAGNFTAHGTVPVFGTGKDSYSLTLGDLDGDGDLDAVVANANGAGETVWLNDGTGAFSAHSTPSFGGDSTRYVGLGDVDGDGDLDAVVANDAGAAETVWLNNGSGVFTAHPSTPSFGAGHSYEVGLGDIDGDGDLDVVVPGGHSTNVGTVWINRPPAGITVTPTSLFNTFEGFPNVVRTFTVVLTSQPSASVTIQIDSGDTTEAAVSPDNVTWGASTSITFTTANWSTAQTIRVRGVNDDVDDGNIGFTIITQPATSTDPLYSGFDAANVTGTTVDNDTAGLTVSELIVYVNESGTSDTFTVRLNSEPTATVVLDVTPSDATEASASPAQLTFTNADWSTPKLVTITGVDDADDDGNQTTQINVAVNTGMTGDSVYDAVSAASVQVLTVDNEEVLIIATSPDANASAGSRSGNIEATADESMNAATATATTFPVHGGFTGTLTGTYGGSGASFHLDPAASLKAGERIDATVTSGVQSATASPVTPYVWQFTAATGRSSGTLFRHPTNATFGAAGSPDGVMGDIDGDGDLDFITATFTVWVNNGSGVFSPHPVTPTVTMPGQTSTIVLADVDADGDLDALTGDDTVGGATWLNDGSGSFSAHPTTPTWANSNLVKAIGVGDIDGDGDLDALLTHQQAPTGVFLNDGNGNFTAHPYTPEFGTIGDFNEDLAMADLDGDGDLDAMTVEQSAAPSTNVWRNDGFGNFTPHPTAPTINTAQAWALALGDIDGDGDPDAIVTMLGVAFDPPTVWVNDGSGVFSAHPTAPTIGTLTARMVALGDMDGDGDLDAILADGDGMRETYWRNDGTGVFTAHPASGTFGNDSTADAVLGDIDDDGDLDVVLVNDNGAPNVWLNAGITVSPRDGLVTTEDGLTDTFAIVLDAEPGANVTIQVDSADTSEALISTDGVTQQSSVVLTFTPYNWATPRTITVHGQQDALADGNVAYTITTGASVSSDASFNGIDLPDVTGTNLDDDGTAVTVTPRALTVSENGTTATFDVSLATMPTGDVVIDVSSTDTGEATVSPAQLTFNGGNFSTPQPVTVTGVNDTINDPSQITRVAVTVNAALTTDNSFDAIDPPDVLATTTDNDFGIVSTNPDANETSAPRNTNAAATAEDAINPATVTTSTLRARGSMTAAIGGTASAAGATMQFDPTSDFKPGETVTMTATNGVQSASAVPLVPHVWQFTAAPSVATGAMVPQSTFGGGQIVDVALGDVDNDGDLDALTANYSGEQDRVFLNDGTGNFAHHMSYSGWSTSAIDLGDFDGDGDLDALLGQYDIASNIGRNDGAGNFVLVTQFPGTSNVTGATAGDVDADGDLDVVLTSASGNTVWLNDGAGVFTAHPVTPSFGSGYHLALGDLDRDGDLDAVTTSIAFAAGYEERVWLNDGTGGFSAAPAHPTFDAGMAAAVALADLDGDGDLDAVIAGLSTTDGVSIWLNNGFGRFALHPDIPRVAVGNQNFDVALGDLDGDGDPDAVVASNGGEPETIWLNDGTGGFTAHPVTPSVGGGNSSGIAMGDVDGDGDLDAVVGHAFSSADSVLINRNPAGVIVTPTSGLVTNESGTTATFTVVLASKPIANVQIAVSSSDTTEGTVSPALLTFTTSDWSTPQTVTVTGVNDSVVDGNVAFTIVTGATSSTDPLYTALAVADVGATNNDNDVAGVNVTPTMVTVSETGTTATFDVVLTSEPVGNVVIGVASGDTSEATVSPAQLTFNAGDWSTPKTVTVTGVDDVIDDNNVNSTVAVTINTALTTDPAYDPLDPGDVTVTTNDNEGLNLVSTSPVSNQKSAPRNTNVAATADANVSGATVTQSTFRVQGSLTGRIAGAYSTSGMTFQLDPTNDLKPGERVLVTATNAIQSTTASALAPRVWQFTAATGAATGVFAPHATPEFGGGDTEDVALGDLDGDGDLDAILGNDSGQAETVWLNNGSGVFTAAGSFGDDDTFGIALGDVDGDGDLDAVLANYSSEAETVWLNNGSGGFTLLGSFGGDSSYDVALGDLDADGDLDAVVANGGGTADSAWRNDGSGVFTQIGSSFGTGDSWDVELGDVDNDGDLDAVIANAGGSGEAETVWLNDGAGNFSAGTPFGADKSKAVALGDVDGDGDLDAIVGNGDPAAPETVWLNNGAGVFSQLGSFGSSDSFDVALVDVDGDGDLDVLDTSPTDGTIVWRNNGSGTFTQHASFGAGAPAFSSAAGDIDGDGDVDVLIGESGQPTTVWINRPAAGITVNPTSGLTTTEAGGTATFTVVLTSAPVANVVIDVASSDTTEGTVSPAQLTFTTANWATPQTVTVTGVNDAIDDGNVAYTLTTDPATSTDPLYNGVDAANVSASNSDNDTVGITVAPTAVTVSESGTTSNFTVVLATEPTGNVVIDLLSADLGEATISPAQLTFTTSDWSTPKTVTVTGVDDAIDDGNQTTNIAVTVNAGLTADPLYDPLDPADVTVTTTDNDDPPFGAPPNFVATASGTTTVATTWNAVTGATNYEVWRTTAINVAYTLATTTTNTFFTDTGRTANTTYLYKVRANGSGGPSPFSAVDPATTIVFADAVPTLIKRIHITELRTAVNAMRAAANMSSFTFTDAVPTSIKRIHIIEIRTALDAARTAIVLPALTYTDPTITAGTTTVKRQHITEPRAGTQ